MFMASIMGMEAKEKENLVKIECEYGTMIVRLYDDTPQHRDNFLKLVKEGFYNDLLFHRVIKDFMVQGGDPDSKGAPAGKQLGAGDVGYTVPAEFVYPTHYHKKGALAAARLGDMANPKRASSGSQFYIVQDERTCAQLDGAYTVFGETLDGFEVIDKIASVQTDQRDRPVKDIKIITIKPVI